MLNPLRKPKQLHLERTYPAPIDRVWEAWTDPELLPQWWGPEPDESQLTSWIRQASQFPGETL